MSAVFVDTSFYVAALNPRDVMHLKALEVGHRIGGALVLSDFVLLELGNAFSGVAQRGLFSNLVAHLRRKSNVRIIPASRDLLDAALELFSHRADKEWSLTDCSSFVIMHEEGLTEALTTDHHFEQAGFVALLR
jgi:predicted nucleic acid-binding protein